MGRVTGTVKHLIIINVIFFVGVKTFGTHLYDFFAIWFPENEKFQLWQVFTHMFMHHPTVYFHIIMNMLALWMFGTPLEQMWGKNKFLFFYFSAGLGAVLLPLLIDYYQFNNIILELTEGGYAKSEIFSILNEGKFDKRWVDLIGDKKLNTFISIFYKSSVGASGAVMGLITAFGISFPNAKMALIFLPIPIAAKYFIPVLLAYEIISGITGGSSILGMNVAHFAHVGGALIGFIIAWYWKKNQFKTL